MGNPRDILNLGIHIGGRNVAVGAVPESAPTLVGDGFPVTVTLPSGIAVTPPNMTCLVDFEGGTDPTAIIQAYGYFPEATDLLSPWQKILETEVGESVNPCVTLFLAGAKRITVIVASTTGSPTSIRLALRGVSGPLPDEDGVGGGPPSPHAPTHIRGASDEIDGDQIDIDYTPVGYTPDVSPPQVTSAEHLTAHLAGISLALSGVSSDIVAANCLASDTEGKLICNNGDSVGGVLQVTTADPYTNTKIPAIGVIISKSSSTDCRVQIAGRITVLSGLTPGKLYWLNTNGTATTTVPTGPGTRYVHAVGVALAANVLLWRPQDVYTLT